MIQGIRQYFRQAGLSGSREEIQRNQGVNYVRKLYEATQVAFQGRKKPSMEQLRQVQQSIMSIPLEQLGLEIKMPNQDELGYQAVFEGKDFTIGIFFVPQGERLPLHDHPNMIVISRLLYGQLQVQSYDWQTDLFRQNKSGKVVPSINRTVDANTSTNPLILYPDKGGNIHEFTALKSCAILDVLAPPYNWSEGRSCTYYGITYDGSDVYLQQQEEPDDFCVMRVPYKGCTVFD
eukprot:TRINITY_DN5474_c0_g1_i3.p2 TRINITY_DN5474_c0_g1~~TRINITY_DN5474_c0_g1_i3.p2  ORF type:complete len:234 (+),score=28.49 TRINITY_DN5474_c0_g1_i3:81-782(+)